MSPDYKVYILNASRERIIQVKNLIKMDNQGNVLRYGKQLSGYGFARFRIAKNDVLFEKHGNFIKPLAYGLQIVRDKTVVFQGIIVNNPHRRKNYIDVEAFGYLWRFKKLQVQRDAADPNEPGKENYRTFSSGTMAAAVTATFNEAKAMVPNGDVFKDFTLGTVENPNFPENFKRDDGTSLTGGWTFSEFITLQFDYKSLLYVYQAFGIYAATDMEVTDDLVFNFKSYIGTRQPHIVFEYGPYGNILDYDAPLLGERTTNDLMGIAADPDGKVLHVSVRNEASVGENGLLQDVSGFLDLKDENALRARINEELKLIATPDSVINIILTPKAYPLGLWSLGDTVTIKIDDGPTQVNQQRRITGYSISVHNTGMELTTVETNPEKDGQ